MSTTPRSPGQLLGTIFAVFVTLLTTSVLTIGFMLLPDLPVLGSVLDQNTIPADRAALDALAAQFRVTLEEQYFNWAVFSIAIGGATLWREEHAERSRYLRSILSIGFIFAALSIILGVGYMDYVTEGLSLGFTMLRGKSPISLYPALQFFFLANSFMLLGFAALLTSFKDRGTTHGQQP